MSPVFYIAVSLSGFAVMTFELALSRMAAPFFGASLPVWASIIALVLFAGAVGYGLGGRLSKRERPLRIASTALIASGAMMGLAAVMFPWLLSAASVSAGHSLGIRLLAIFCFVVFASTALIGAGGVMPLFVRAAVKDAADSGSVAGRLFAAATVGSLLGTLLPAFVLFAFIGVSRTMLGMGVVLVVLGMLIRHRRFGAVATGIVMMSGAMLASPVSRPAFHGRKILYETESREHARILVLENRRGDRELRLDMAVSVQSTYRPEGPSRRGSWPRFLPAALLRKQCETPPESVLILGIAAGTIARDIEFAYPNASVVGVDTDAALFDIGRRFFALPKKTALHAMDAREYLQKGNAPFDLIFLDAYKDIYVPFHLATQAFFKSVKNRLAPGGVFAANILFFEKEDRLLRGILNTMASVFEHTAVLKTKNLMNAVLYAWDGPALNALPPKRCALPKDVQQERRTLLYRSKLSSVQFNPEDEVFTDDKSPVEHLTHRIAWRVLLNAFGVGSK